MRGSADCMRACSLCASSRVAVGSKRDYATPGGFIPSLSAKLRESSIPNSRHAALTPGVAPVEVSTPSSAGATPGEAAAGGGARLPRSNEAAASAMLVAAVVASTSSALGAGSKHRPQNLQTLQRVPARFARPLLTSITLLSKSVAFAAAFARRACVCLGGAEARRANASYSSV